MGSGVTGENYVQVFKDVAAACPDCKLYGPDGVAEAAFTDPKEGGIPADVAARTKVTVATLSPEEFEKQGIDEAVKFFDDFEAKYGIKQPDPYAIYGYETMALALDTLEAVGDKANDREAVRKQLLENTKGRDSVLGTYDIDENGDTTLTDYGLYVDRGRRADVRSRSSRRRAASNRTESDAKSGGGGSISPPPLAFGIDCRETWKPHRSPLKHRGRRPRRSSESSSRGTG